jgi:prophage tail gpP-like protein
MPPVTANTEIGSDDDIVKFYINGSLVKYTKYSVTMGIMAQPSTFSVTLGSGDVAGELLKKITPNSKAELFVGPTRVQYGIIEDVAATSGGGATEVTFSGRDWINPLVKTYVRNEKSFGVATYYELTRQVLDICGLKDRSLDGDNNVARQKATRSVKVKAEPASDVVEQIETGAITRPGTKIVYNRIVAKLGQTWWDFLKSQYKQVGLYLWATPDGGFVLARPTAKQRPLYYIHHGRGLSRDQCNITSLPYQNRTSGRHSKCTVMSRVGSGPKGRGQVYGDWVDFEMTQYGFTDEIVIHDNDCKSVAACEYLAKRTLAEERRANCSITVTVSGHTTPSLLDSGKMVVWAPDTMVTLKSDEYGFEDDFYIEEVTYTRDPKTTTTLKLMRKLDLIYLGESDPELEKHTQDATQRARSVDLRVGSSAATDTAPPGDIPVGELTPVPS